MSKFKVGDMVTPISKGDKWYDIGCKVMRVIPSGYVVDNGRGERTRLFVEHELQSVSEYALDLNLEQLEKDPEFRKKTTIVEVE